MTPTPRITIWNEGRHEQRQPEVAALYPEGIHGAIAAGLREHGLTARTATLDEPDHGLSAAALEETDVLFWWGHKAHHEVADDAVERVYRRVLAGMGLIVLHSSHFSKIFTRLMGTTCSLKWRPDNEKERLWVVDRSHPIAAGLDEYIELEQEEMYGEPFDAPPPEELVFISWFQGGEVFRSGCCYRRGSGKIFYFRPGHETNPTYHHPAIRRVLANAARWAAPTGGPPPVFGRRPPLEQLP